MRIVWLICILPELIGILFSRLGIPGVYLLHFEPVNRPKSRDKPAFRGAETGLGLFIDFRLAYQNTGETSLDNIEKLLDGAV